MNVAKRYVPSLLFCVVCISMLIKIVACSSCQIKLLVLVGGANVGARPWLGEITLWNTHKSHKALLLIMNI
jgi:hypothetical protein